VSGDRGDDPMLFSFGSEPPKELTTVNIQAASSVLLENGCGGVALAQERKENISSQGGCAPPQRVG
jgi:hypothetical protein